MAFGNLSGSAQKYYSKYRMVPAQKYLGKHFKENAGGQGTVQLQSC